MNKKLIFILGITVLILAVIFNIPENQVVVSPPSLTSPQVYTSQEYKFSVVLPTGWSYETTGEKVRNSILVVEIIDPSKNIRIPIFVEQLTWDQVLSEARKNFKPETINVTEIAGQPALIIKEDKLKSDNPDYVNYRIQHPLLKNTILLGTAATSNSKEKAYFYDSVNSILNSIKFN